MARRGVYSRVAQHPKSGWPDSNRRPLRPKHSALPTAPHPEDRGSIPEFPRTGKHGFNPVENDEVEGLEEDVPPTSYHMCEKRGRGQIMRNERNLAQLRRSGVRSRCGGLEFNGRCSRTARLTAAHNGDEQFSLRNRVATAKIDHPKPDAESGRIL